jgi:hypothetical protein
MTKLRVEAVWETTKEVQVINFTDDPENVYLEMDIDQMPEDRLVFANEVTRINVPLWEPRGNKAMAQIEYRPDLLIDLESNGYTLDLTAFDKGLADQAYA